MQVNIRRKLVLDQGLWVDADVFNEGANYSGGLLLDLSESASDDEIKAKIAEAYGGEVSHD